MHLPSSFPLELIAARDGMTIRWNYMELDDEDNVAYMSEKIIGRILKQIMMKLPLVKI